MERGEGGGGGGEGGEARPRRVGEAEERNIESSSDEGGGGEKGESKGGRSKVREGEKKDENRGCKIHAGCTKRN